MYREVKRTAQGGIAFGSVGALSRFTLVAAEAIDDESLTSTMNAETSLSATVQRAYDAHVTTPPPELSIHRGFLSDFVVEDATGQIQAILHALQNINLVDVNFLRLLVPPLSPVNRVILICNHRCSMYDLDEADSDSLLLYPSREYLMKASKDVTTVVSDICRDGWLMGN